MHINKDEFRQALGCFASGVTVLTTRDASHEPRGLTVSAFSSLSIDPPLVLVCVDKRADSHAAFKESGAFVVNILANDQESLSRRFATKAANKFEGITYYKGIEDAPVLSGALANLECRIVQAYEGGDHTIFVGEVERNSTRDAQPLLYFRGGYAELNRER